MSRVVAADETFSYPARRERLSIDLLWDQRSPGSNPLREDWSCVHGRHLRGAGMCSSPFPSASGTGAEQLAETNMSIVVSCSCPRDEREQEQEQEHEQEA